MRKRLAILAAFAVGAAALGWVVFKPQQAPLRPVAGDDPAPATEPRQPPDGLSDEDEAALRATVSKHEFWTQRWAPGGGDPYDFRISYRVLCLPDEVGEIYARKPLGTLRSLKRIVEAGTAADAHTAIAYAHAAVGYANDDPVLLIHAWMYACSSIAKEFDDVNPVFPKTYRQFAVEEIDGLIAAVEKKLREPAAGR